MRKVLNQKGLDDRAQALGFVPDSRPVSLYRQAEPFVLPSILEPFGMTALVAMACGRPVVASSVGGVRNVVKSGENVLLADPSEATEFADAVTSPSSDGTIAQKLGLEGQGTIHRLFNREAIAGRHREFYEEFMS